jgi:hypothetical protein
MHKDGEGRAATYIEGHWGHDPQVSGLDRHLPLSERPGT